MIKTRREFIAGLVGTIGAIGIIVAAPSQAQACMYGTWYVRCPNGHDDKVEDGTCNHTCEKCGAKALSNGDGYVVCPNGHANHVSTGTSHDEDKVMKSYRCRDCGKECRRDI